jgi:membrane-bound ClpP family serine protease
LFLAVPTESIVPKQSCSRCTLALLATIAIILGMPAVAAQDQQANRAKIGYLIDVPVPLGTGAANRLLDQLARLAESAPEGERITVVLRYSGDDESGDETDFEDALKLARAMTGTGLRRVRVVSLVEREVNGHSVLPILSSDLLIVSRIGVIADASAGESGADDTITLSYRSIAERRGLFPPAVAAALVNPELELVQVSKVGGQQVFAAGEELTKLRKSGDVLGEDVWSVAGVPLRLDAKQLRSVRIAAGLVESLDEAAELLDLAELNPINERIVTGEAKGVLLEITGAIVAGRSRRWQSNLNSTLQSGDVNTWVITIDSSGGSLDNSATLAGWFAEPDPPLRTVAGLVRGEARGDAALVAVACKPLFMQPDSRLGGPGAEAITPEALGRYEELIDQIAISTKRPSALIRGVLDPQLVVHRYTNQKTGRVRYATEEDLAADAKDAEDAEAERAKWQRGDRIELADGLTSSEAIALGLADGESRSLEDTSRRVGLGSTPPAVSDRGLVRFVEKIGRSNSLAFLLLFIGFAALSAEANAPGLSVPGFIALICFGFYFWMKFLAGTAEWLELVAFTLGLVCIAIEIFVVPGFGVFGIGGLALTVLGVVLMSQTFVVPRNVYQVQVLTRGIWVALGGAGGLVGGFVVIRMMLPHVPLLRGLVMEAPNEETISESEKLGDYSALLGQTGTATTPLRLSGKARFGDQIVQVVSDGTAISAGDLVRVSEVHATKVVVEPVEN